MGSAKDWTDEHKCRPHPHQVADSKGFLHGDWCVRLNAAAWQGDGGCYGFATELRSSSIGKGSPPDVDSARSEQVHDLTRAQPQRCLDQASIT